MGVIEGYDRWAAWYDQEPNPLITLEEPVTLELIGNVQGQRVLDLACGTGRYCALLAQRGAEVVGLDGSLQMLARARRKRMPGSRLVLSHGSIERLPFPDAYCDLVVCALTLGHLAHLAPIFSEMVRVLKQGGRMVLSDVHPFWPVSGHDYTEFFDPEGQEYRLPLHAHLVGDYWSLSRRFGLMVEDVCELRIDETLVTRFSSLVDLLDIPLAIILSLRK